MMLHRNLIGPSTSLSGSSNNALQTSAALNDSSLLSHSLSQQAKEELKTQFSTREGTYRVMTLAEYSRPNRGQQLPVPPSGVGAGNGNVPAGAPVRVSFVSVAALPAESPGQGASTSVTRPDDFGELDDAVSDKICFNIGRELYVYNYRGTHSAADLTRPLDKRVYKGIFPTAHHFNQETAKVNSCSLIIGFSTGQLQLVDPLNKDYPASRLYNEELLIEKSGVTCLRWIPGQPHLFLVSHASGNMYVYNEDLPCAQAPPSYQLFKQGEKFSIYTCKAKTSKNPLYRWQVGEGIIHQFAFSGADAKFLATVGQDGFLRVFNYHQMELLSVMKSYFGGLLTLSWSPDAKLIATGGEDDLLTVYSVAERRVVCRGQGHKSWISQVQFDPYCCTTEDELEMNGYGLNGLDEPFLESGDTKERAQTSPNLQGSSNPVASTSSTNDVNAMTPVMRAHAKRATLGASSTMSRCSFASFGTINGVAQSSAGVCYRIGSVGHDTQLCLWDISEDMLKPANVQRHRNSTIIAPMIGLEIQTSPHNGGRLDPLAEASPGGANANGASTSSDPSPSGAPPPAAVKEKKKKRFHRRNFTLGRLTGGQNSTTNPPTTNAAGSNNAAVVAVNGGSERRKNFDSLTAASSPVAMSYDASRLLGTKICPRIQDVPVIEPLMCKKVAHERLTVLEFRRDCVVTACQEGFICTWARPGKSPMALAKQRELRNMNSPGTTSPEQLREQRNDAHYEHDVAPPRSASIYSGGMTTSLSAGEGNNGFARPANHYSESGHHAFANPTSNYRASPSTTAAVANSYSGYNWNNI